MSTSKQFLLFFLVVTAFGILEAVLTPEDEDYFGHTADRYDWSKHPCRRKCSKDEKPKTCHYVFVVEHYTSMSKACYDCPHNITDCFRPHCIPADGVPKTLYVVNRQLPGPLIEVCEDDEIVIEVRNKLLSESTTIHFHGFKQRKTPYMDGVPYVTQCPIPPGTTFTYTFKATTMGTFFWHSHIGNQRGDGLFGPMVVNRRDELTRGQYDYDEHRMIVTDWNHLAGPAAFEQLYHQTGQLTDTSILVNGRGRFQKFEAHDGRTLYTPLAMFNVKKGMFYRFRYIDAGFDDCPMELSIDNHTMVAISLDSNDIVATEVDWITSWPGERYDFIIRANQKPGNYWIRLRGLRGCRIVNETDGAHQVAILHYDEVELQEPREPVAYTLPKATNGTRVLNAFNTGTEMPEIVDVNIPNLTSLEVNDVSLKENPDKQVYISFDSNPVDNYDFHRKHLYGFNQVQQGRGRVGTSQFDRLTLQLPDFPLLSQYDFIEPGSFCNATHRPKNRNCTTEQCSCIYVIQLELNSVVELVFVDQGKAGILFNHPLHLHGYFYRVVAEKNLDGVVTIDRVKKLDREGKIKRRLDRAPLKDTMKTPGGGYMIARLHADNPGYWFFHCHFDMHHNVGMAIIFKIGEHKDFPKKPKGFPRCGHRKTKSSM